MISQFSFDKSQTSLPNSKNLEQQYNLYRMCNSYTAMPFNFYSTMVMDSNNLNVCDDDLCNGGGATPSNSALIMSTIWLFITLAILV